jgi:hypothetical protein
MGLNSDSRRSYALPMMLAAASTSTGKIIAGIVVLLIGLTLIVGVIWLLWRLVSWPFRARRRARPAGLGSDYEQMIRQQLRTRPPTGDGNPPYYPLPPDWQRRLGQPEPTAPSLGSCCRRRPIAREKKKRPSGNPRRSCRGPRRSFPSPRPPSRLPGIE